MNKQNTLPARYLQWMQWGFPTQGLPLVHPEEAQAILLRVPGLYKDNPSTYNQIEIGENIVDGFYRIQKPEDPLSNFWTGASFLYEGTLWPSRQHAITMARLRATGVETLASVRRTLLTFAANDPYRAKYYEQTASVPQYAQEWQNVRTKLVNQIVLQAAFQNSHVMMALLHPEISQENYPQTIGFRYRGDPYCRDFFWTDYGQNVMGYILSDARYVLQSVATHIKHYSTITIEPTVIYEFQSLGHGISTAEIPCEIYHYLKKTAIRQSQNEEDTVNS